MFYFTCNHGLTLTHRQQHSLLVVEQQVLLLLDTWASSLMYDCRAVVVVVVVAAGCLDDKFLWTHLDKLSSCNSIFCILSLPQQLRKVLWTWKMPVCLLTLLHAYGKPRLCTNIHHYAPVHSVCSRCSAARRAAAGRCDTHGATRTALAVYCAVLRVFN